MRAWVIMLVLFALAPRGGAAPAVLVNGVDIVNIRTSALAILDPKSELDAATVLRLSRTAPERFEPVLERYRFFEGYLWLVVEVTNQDHPDRDWVFDMDDRIAPIMDIFVFRGETQERVHHLGTRLPASQKAMKSRSFSFEQSFEPGATRTIVVRTWNYTVTTNLTAHTWRAYQEVNAQTNMVHTVYFAVAGALFLYNMFLYFTLRYVSYLQYLGFISGMVMQIAINIGALHYFTSDIFLFPHEYNYVYRSFVLMTAQAFTRAFLNLKVTFPRADRFMAVNMYFMFAVMVMNATRYNRLAVSLTDFAIMFMGVSVIIIASVVYRRGYRQAIYYLISWIGLISCVCYWILAGQGVFPTRYLNQFMPEIGQIFEMLLISIGLGDHINTLVADKNAAEIKAIEGEKNRTLVRVISHDLMNPVSIIVNYADIHLKSPHSAGDSLRSWQRVMHAARHQQEIISHVQTMDAILSGKQHLDLGSVEFAPLLQKVASLYEEKLAAKLLTLVIEPGPPGLYVTAEGPSLGNSVMNNLISNAIKFSNKGARITITVAEQDDVVTVSVADQGIGMDNELQKNIFDPYKPTTRRGTAGERGTGFGMPILKSYIEIYGGSVSVESRPMATHPDDHGTTFVIKLKRASSQAVAEPIDVIPLAS